VYSDDVGNETAGFRFAAVTRLKQPGNAAEIGPAGDAH
jgi:hypothetical protein